MNDWRVLLGIDLSHVDHSRDECQRHRMDANSVEFPLQFFSINSKIVIKSCCNLMKHKIFFIVLINLNKIN